MKVTHLFPSPLIESCLDIDIPKGKTYSFVETSASSLISSERRVLKEYPEVEKAILDEFQKIVDEYLHYDNKFIITTSWFTRTEKGQNSSIHNHKNSFWSGVFYFDDYEDDASGLSFESPLLNLVDFSLEPTEFNLINSMSWLIKPYRGKIVFFPSYLLHQILLSPADKPRHSLAFNIVPIGTYGQADSTYSTDWT